LVPGLPDLPGPKKQVPGRFRPGTRETGFDAVYPLVMLQPAHFPHLAEESGAEASPNQAVKSLVA